MKEQEFRSWLENSGTDEKTIGSRISSSKRMEAAIGDLDERLDAEGYETLSAQFSYSAEDERDDRPNPSSISIDGNLRIGLASLKQALRLYDMFRKNIASKTAHSELVNRVTRTEIEAAMEECRDVGTDRFLRRYNFKNPRNWVQEVDRPEQYPAKAIVAVALGQLEGGKSLTASEFFNGFGEAQSFNKLKELGYTIINKDENDNNAGVLSRQAVEDVMDAFDRHRKGIELDTRFEKFGSPRSYWVRSSRIRDNKVYPSKTIVCYILGKEWKELNGGWGSKSDAAAKLHNSGFIIVDEQDKPVIVPSDKPFLIGDADRIRLCVLNYFIAPARERGETHVSIRAVDLSKERMLNEAWPNVCQALKSKKFQELADVPEPVQEGPDASTTTVFTFDIRADRKWPTMKTDAATNLILYGPPGTGKTYGTSWEAVRLCLGGEAAAAFENDRNALMAEFRRLVGEGRIEFVTFHQSMSYEEFVEGLRPVTDSEENSETGSGFRLEPFPGIFHRISKRAEAGARRAPEKDAEDDVQRDQVRLEGRCVHQMSLGAAGTPGGEAIFEEAIENSIALFGFVDHDWSASEYKGLDKIRAWCEQTNEELYASPDGVAVMTHHFRNKVSVGDILVVSKGNFQFRAIGEVLGDYKYVRRENGHYSHRRSVQWLWVDRDGVPVDELHDSNFMQKTIYSLKKERLKIPALERYMISGHARGENALTNPEHFVLIIDEINRANISKVFGELITLLEQDKRLGAPNEIRVQLPYSKKRFGVPHNLHIVGTMNTADRSIALLDTALRRRFTFQELMPNPAVLSKDVGGINLQALLSTINERIEYLFDREHQIGHAYFTGCRSRVDVIDVMRHKVIPLLAEYFYEDWAKVAAVLGDGPGVTKKHFLESVSLQLPKGMPEDDMNGGKLRWSVKEDFDFSEFEG